MQAYEKATRTHDLEGALALIADEAVYFFSNETVYADKAAIRQALARNFALIQQEAYSITNLIWLARSGKMAACIYDFAWSGVVGGKPASGSGRGTSVFQRKEDGWKVIHEHLSKGKSASSD